MRIGVPGSILAVALAAFATGAKAAASDPVQAGEAAVRLLAARISDTNSAPVFSGGIEIVLTPGWKTYWRYPGDAGIPPRFDWAGSENVANIEVLYPAPERIADDSGQNSIGYEKRVVFPLRIRAADPAKPVRLNLKLDFATCEKICIPAQAELVLNVSPESGPEPALAGAEEKLPRKAKLGDAQIPAVLAVKLKNGKAMDAIPHVLVTVRTENPAEAELFAEGPDEEWTLALPEKIAADGNTATFSISLDGSRLGKAEIPPALRLTLVSGTLAVEVVAPLD